MISEDVVTKQKQRVKPNTAVVSNIKYSSEVRDNNTQLIQDQQNNYDFEIIEDEYAAKTYRVRILARDISKLVHINHIDWRKYILYFEILQEI